MMILSPSTAYCTWQKRLIRWIGAIGFSLFIFVIILDGITGCWVKDKIYTNIEQLPQRQTALVLGTSKYYAKGTPNLYYRYRLEAAQALLTQGKVRELLLSGDNKTPYYNEPKTMRSDLIKMGIASGKIQQDFAGYRTLDSILRASQVYQLNNFVIVTQAFHCERALFIAKTRNIDAICFAAKYPEGHIKVRIREFFARMGMLWDYFMNTQPETFEKLPAKKISKSG